MMSSVAVGNPVHTSDGKDLGKVKEIVGGCFKVDAPMQPDYWLATDAVTGSSTDGGVTVRFTKDQLGEAKQEGPEHTGYHRHM